MELIDSELIDLPKPSLAVRIVVKNMMVAAHVAQLAPIALSVCQRISGRIEIVQYPVNPVGNIWLVASAVDLLPIV
jgi:hypothetical protein